jgi:D-alanyl-D-alanine carboxypeptidase
VQAKTGAIARVVCLSGYVPRPDAAAPPLVFSVMLNDFTCDDALAKAAIDAFVERLAAAAGW